MKIRIRTRKIRIPPPVYDCAYKTPITRHAREVVKAVFASKPSAVGLSTQEIYRCALEMFPGKPPTEHPDPASDAPVVEGTYPIRSLRYLKKFVLEAMLDEGLVQKFHMHVKGEHTDDSGRAVHVIAAKDGPQLTVPRLDLRRGRTTIWMWRWLTDEDRAAMDAKKAAIEAYKAVAVEERT